MCNAASWLQEKEIECLRIAHSANVGTPQCAEWKWIAEAIAEQRAIHGFRCPLCGQELNTAQKRGHHA